MSSTFQKFCLPTWVKTKKSRRHKKYTPLKHHGWIGYGYIDYEQSNGVNYRILFEVRFNHLDKEIKKKEAFTEHVMDELQLFAEEDGINSDPVNLKMLHWAEWYR